MSETHMYDLNLLGTIDVDNEEQYKRTKSSLRKEASDLIKSLYGSGYCELASSGINAIYVTFKAILTLNKNQQNQQNQQNKNNITIFVSDEVFSGTRTYIFKKLFKDYADNIDIIYFDVTNKHVLIKNIVKYRDTIKCIFIESVSNPNGKMIDWSIFDEYKDILKQTYVIVDNTFLSPELFNPFLHGANIVIDSGSKYLSDTKCISGVISIKMDDNLGELRDEIDNQINYMGIHFPDIYADLIIQGIASLENRVIRAHERTVHAIDVIKEISDKYDIDVINHTSLQNVNYANYIKKLYPVVNVHYKSKFFREITDKVYVKDLYELIDKTIRSSKFELKTSFGHKHDSIDNYYKINRDGIWLRFAIGYEETELDFKSKICGLFDSFNLS
ncbi:MAG: cystathionine gamma-synthase [Terrestrivirus sp.]|uniref:Cystathionine gamma-synthase n=1 Tax=Terrestrivirus sp. TaxID=2487775 RepID=A0A3G4ZPS6_9VIRU|nr:MAG: cystathionine gamma-synthase [Terrestrivirus sp.]